VVFVGDVGVVWGVFLYVQTEIVFEINQKLLSNLLLLSNWMEFSSVVFQIWIFISGGGGEQKIPSSSQKFSWKRDLLNGVKFVFFAK